MAFTLVHYSQQDPAWKSDKIGTSSETIGYVGCAITSIAMLVSGHGYPETPKTLNAKLKTRGGYVDASIIWGAVTSIYPQVVYRNLVLCRDTNAPLTRIDASITAGQPVLVEVDNSPKAGLQSHWVVLYAKREEDYLMLDPWPFPVESGKEVSLMPRYSHGKQIQKSITAVVFYECLQTGPGSAGKATTTEPVQPPEPGTYVEVPATVASGLRLRSAPTTSSGTLTVEPPGALLRVVEPLDLALPKLGLFDQWIKVRDAGGREGYVAAWYVERSPVIDVPGESPVPPALDASEISSTPEPAPGPAPVIVYVSGEATAGLRLRSGPSTDAATLKILAPKTPLTLLYGQEGQVGVYNTWLKVRDSQGSEGFVAAWYVRK